MKQKSLLFTLTAAGALLAGTSVQAATVFLTNTNGNASALQGDGPGDTTALTLSAEDGGGTIDFNTIDVFQTSTTTIGMDTTSMGTSNSKFGDANSRLDFSFGTTVDFSGITISGTAVQFTLQSADWVGDTVTTGTGWSFNSGTGSIVLANNGETSFDFSSTGLSQVTADTQISIFKSGGASGVGIKSFTITPVAIPEPSSSLLIGAAGMFLLLRRRRA